MGVGAYTVEARVTMARMPASMVKDCIFPCAAEGAWEDRLR